MRVSLSGGVVPAFFEPGAQRRARHAEGPGDPAHTRALLIGADDFCFSFLAVAVIGLVEAGPVAFLTVVALFAVRRSAVFLYVLAPAVIALHRLSDHPLA